MKNIDKLISWFKQNSGWIKIVSALLLLLLLILVATDIGCVRKSRDKFIQEITNLHTSNDNLTIWNQVLSDSIFLQNEDKIRIIRNNAILKLKNDSLIVLSNKQKRKLNEISQTVAGMKADSVYNHLTTIAYPDTGKAIYPFSEGQIRQIDETYFREEALESLVDILEQQINNSSIMTSSMDSLVTSYQYTQRDLTIQNSNLNNIIDNKNREIDLYKKQEKRISRNGIFWKVSTGVASTIALILVFK